MSFLCLSSSVLYLRFRRRKPCCPPRKPTFLVSDVSPMCGWLARARRPDYTLLSPLLSCLWNIVIFNTPFRGCNGQESGHPLFSPTKYYENPLDSRSLILFPSTTLCGRWGPRASAHPFNSCSRGRRGVFLVLPAVRT